MVTNYSIDELYPRIQDSRTKEYLDEVLSCFYSGNYRSAIVMLYSVAICDLVFKLHRLKDIYNDQPAVRILSSIETMQDANPKSPDWENYLREELLKSRRILSPATYTHLENLQKERHLCAHPILKDSIELFRPNKLAVQAHIVNILSDILIIPPFLEKELLGEILKDMDSQRRHLRSKQIVEDYLKSRYLDKIQSPEIECRIFIHLWKFVFHLSNEECNRNRNKNYLFLRLLLDRNHDLIMGQIATESEKLSRQIDIDSIPILDLFVKFMNKYPGIYYFLDDSFKISVEAKIETNTLIDHIAFFLHGDFKEYYPILKSNIAEDDDLPYILEYTEQKLNREAAMSLVIAIFSRSDSFDDANNNYSHLIKPRLQHFSVANFEELLKAIDNNGQISNSWGVQGNFRKIKETLQSMQPDFDFTPYDFIH